MNNAGRRLEFCEKIYEEVFKNPQLLRHICFSDESTFFLNDDINSQNLRFRCESNPRIFRMNMTKCVHKINVSAKILGENIVVFCFTEKIYSDAYLKMLKGIIDPLIMQIFENSV